MYITAQLQLLPDHILKESARDRLLSSIVSCLYFSVPHVSCKGSTFGTWLASLAHARGRESSDSMGSYSSSFLSFFSGQFCTGGNIEPLSVVDYGAVSVPSASILSFEHEDRDWVDAIEQSCKLESGCRMADEQESFGFAYPSALGKRQCEDSCDMPSPKKQCSRKMKEKSISPSKDSQSVAAKNRRQRISERLKILQDLIPNGTKVDLVTMLEKAISYVKFLQLQAKVLATDEFWTAQRGRAPDIGQVKKAIDAILCSQRDRNSSSKH